MNLFMVCRAPERSQFGDVPEGFHLRALREEELPLWEGFPFDGRPDAAQRAWMRDYFEKVYAPRRALFFRRCQVVTDGEDLPVATCFLWPAYEGRINTLHWLKVLPAYEGRGIGRGLLSRLLGGLGAQELPLFLHTQPESFRAIKLYTDLGFDLITDRMVGPRPNDLAASLPLLRGSMPARDYARLRFASAPAGLLSAASSSPISEF